MTESGSSRLQVYHAAVLFHVIARCLACWMICSGPLIWLSFCFFSFACLLLCHDGSYLNRADVQQALHVVPGTVWDVSSSKIDYEPADMLRPMMPYYTRLIDEYDMAILIFSGVRTPFFLGFFVVLCFRAGGGWGGPCVTCIDIARLSDTHWKNWLHGHGVK